MKMNKEQIQFDPLFVVEKTENYGRTNQRQKVHIIQAKEIPTQKSDVQILFVRQQMG